MSQSITRAMPMRIAARARVSISKRLQSQSERERRATRRGGWPGMMAVSIRTAPMANNIHRGRRGCQMTGGGERGFCPGDFALFSAEGEKEFQGFEEEGEGGTGGRGGEERAEVLPAFGA